MDTDEHSPAQPGERHGQRPARRIRTGATAAAVLSLGLAAGLIAASPAPATPPAGVTAEIVGSGTTLGGFKIHVDGIKVTSTDAVSFTVAHLTFAPGGTTGWHVHPGPVLVIVKTGSVTKYSADDCTAQTYTARQAFVENGPTDENMVRNNGSVPAETIVTFLTPPGAPIREDAPAPPSCNP
jgi:quercetin dioxygenase-like cupin family protein